MARRCSIKRGCSYPRANWWKQQLGTDYYSGGGGEVAAPEALAFQTRVEADSGAFEGLSFLSSDIEELGDFYNDASFLITANGVKTSKIYALKPTDGSGDLTFSRSTTAFRKSSTAIESQAINLPRLDYLGRSPGLLLESDRTTLNLRSQELDNASWVKVNATVTANATTAPDGTLTADKIIESSSASVAHFVRQNVTKSTALLSYTVYGFFKKGERTWVRVMGWDAVANGAHAWFNLDTGERGTLTSFGTRYLEKAYDIIDVGDGWYLCYIRFTTNNATTISAAFALATGDQNQTYAGDGASGLYVWGGKLAQGSNPLIDSYVITTTAAVQRGADTITALSAVSDLIGQTPRQRLR